MLEKIKKLFEYRMLPELIDEAAGADKPLKFINSLYALQYAIYNLDAHLESNWNIPVTDLEPYWSKINSILKSDFDIESEAIPEFISEILTYQKHELGLRNGQLPINLDPIYFYFFKSCDVKLIRKLIYNQYPKLNEQYQNENWKAFDLITELNDDVEDIFEDLDTINGNAVLIKAHHQGIPAARKYVDDLIDEIEQLIQNQKEEIAPKVLEATHQRIRETKILTDEVFHKLDASPEILNTSKLQNLLLMEV